MSHPIVAFLLDNKWQIGFASYVVYSIMVSALPDDLHHFDWYTYIPSILKGLAGVLSSKFPKVQEKPPL